MITDEKSEVVHRRDHTIVVAQCISGERAICACFIGVPVVGKRQQDINAMLLGQLDHFIQLLKSIRAVIDGDSSVWIDVLEPSPIYWYGVDV
jgi:hypothetical protein